MTGLSMTAEAKNLEAISKAIDQHNSTCPNPLIEVRMNPFEAARLGWDTIRGVRIVQDEAISTGRFRLVCDGQHSGDGAAVEAVGVEVEEPERVAA